MNKISKKHILVIVLLVVLGAGLVFGLIAGFNALQVKMDRTRVEVLSRTDPEAALEALKASSIVDNDLSAYLSVLVLSRRATDAETDVEAMDQLAQLVTSAETALTLGVLSQEHTATVEALLAAARGNDTCTAAPYAALQQLLEYSAATTAYSYRLQRGQEFSPDILLEELNSLTQSYDTLYTQVEGELGEYADEAKQLGEDIAALMALLTKDLAELPTSNTFRFQFIPPEWSNLDEAVHVNHDALQLVMAERVLPEFYACIEALELAPVVE
jgi:hypothetical protein